MITRRCARCGQLQYPCPSERCVYGGWKHFGSGMHMCQPQESEE